MRRLNVTFAKLALGMILSLHFKTLQKTFYLMGSKDLGLADNEQLSYIPTVEENPQITKLQAGRKSESTRASSAESIATNTTFGRNPFMRTQQYEVPRIYRAGNWDSAPIVIEEYRLLFFTQGKVACTVFKQLLRRMMHIEDWSVHKEPHLPHNPARNGLKYLYHYNPIEALDMMTSPHWTRAIFVRDPKERALSAYLDKVARKDGTYYHKHCCPKDANKTCAKIASKSFLDFITLSKDHCCCDPHWMPQSMRIPNEFWNYVDFVGRFEHLAEDTLHMLRLVNASDFGNNGWGKYGNETIFAEGTSAKHQTSASSKTCGFYNKPGAHEMVESFYEEDYLNPLLNFSRDVLSATCN